MTDRLAWQRRRNGVDRMAAQRGLAWAGIAAPLIFWMALITAGLIRPGYSAIREYGSELGVGPHAWLMNGAFILWGLLEMAFALGLYRSLADTRGAVQLGAALIGVAGCAMVLVGLFPMALNGKRSLPGSIHAHAAELLFAALIAAYLILAGPMQRDARWRGYAICSALAGVLSLLLFVLYRWGGDFVSVSAEIGLVQRILLAVTMGWLEIVAIHVLFLTAKSGALTAPQRRMVNTPREG